MALGHLAIRVVHVLGMALLVGGAAFAWGYYRRLPDHPQSDNQQAVAAGYEWLFWGAMGVMVMTGVGNLGALAPGLPGPETAWGTTFTVKVIAVLGLLVGSVVRTLAVTHPADAGLNPQWCQRAYGVTALALVGILILAEVLAHG